MPRYPLAEVDTSAFDSFTTASDSQGDLSRLMVDSSSDGIAFYYDELDRSTSTQPHTPSRYTRYRPCSPRSPDDACSSPGLSHSAEVSRELIAVATSPKNLTKDQAETAQGNGTGDLSDGDIVEELTSISMLQDTQQPDRDAQQPKARKLSVARPTPLSMIREESMNSLSYSLSQHSIQSLSTPPMCSTPVSKKPSKRAQCPPAPLPRTSLPSALSLADSSEEMGSDYSNRTVIIHDIDDEDDASDTFSLSSDDCSVGHHSPTPSSSTRRRANATDQESVDELDYLLNELKAAEVRTADRVVAETPRQVSGVQTRAAARRAAAESFREACSASPCPALAAKARHRSVGLDASPTRAFSANFVPTPFPPLGLARNTRSKTASPIKSKGKARAHVSPRKVQQPLRPVKSAARLRSEVSTAPLQISKRANFDGSSDDQAESPRKGASKTPTARYTLRRITRSDASLRTTSSFFRAKGKKDP